MIHLPGYQILDQIVDEESWTLYKAYSAEENKMVALKRLKYEDKATRLVEATHDYHMSQLLEHKGILKPYQLIKHGSEMIIVTEYFSGTTLREWLKKESGKQLNMRSFLQMAINLTSILTSIQQNQIIHKRLNPQHILFDPQTFEIKITGFHHATQLSSEPVSPIHLLYEPYHMKYLSPEQTGRMNIPLDYRTDLYSLGIVFYELLTGKVPFEFNHVNEIVHAHLAVAPQLPKELEGSIPESVSSIVLKLLEKSPDARYQSTFGLKADLEHCLQQLNREGAIHPFQLGKQDVLVTLKEHNKLYGRERELSLLMNTFRKLGDEHVGLVLISGRSGIGKTALVNELHKPIAEQKGYFISGKFNPLHKQTPYFPIIQAFKQLIKYILSEGPENILMWKKRFISHLLPTQMRVMTNFIPELEWLVGKQKEEVTPLSGEEMHYRFLVSIQHFIIVFSKFEQPIVLFMDDLQWADHATLDLIQHILLEHDNKYLLVIGAYRDDEVTAGHPFDFLLGRLREKKISITDIPIGPLEYDTVHRWLMDIFEFSLGEQELLGRMIYRITKGNPFFINQLIKSFYHDQIIFFNADVGKWDIHLDRLNLLSVADTIADYMIRKVDNSLTAETKELLQLASCFGNQFDLKSLAAITGEKMYLVSEKLWHALEEGIILPMDANYKWVYLDDDLNLVYAQTPVYMFLHDKMQQTFYESMSIEQREQFHLQIGRELWRFYMEEKKDDNLFEVVTHLNLVLHYLTEEEKRDVIELNWLAGERAKSRAAFASALAYFKVATELLPSDCWFNPLYYECAYKVTVGLGEAQYLNQQFDKAERTFDELLKHVHSIEEKVNVYNLKMMLYTHVHQVEKAVDAVLEGLSLFDLKIKRNPRKWDVAKELLLTKYALRQKKGRHLLDLPPVSDQKTTLLMHMLINTGTPTFLVNQYLATILMLKGLRLTLKHGDLDLSALVYNNYALILSAGLQDYDNSYYFGSLGIKHAEKYQDTSIKARAYFIFASFVNHWKRPLHRNLEYLYKSKQLSIESGNLHLAGASCSFIGMILFSIGNHLGDVKEKIKRERAFVKKNEYMLSSDYLGETLDWIDILSTPESQVEWHFAEITDDVSTKIIHYTLRLQMAYLFDHESVALSMIDILEPLVDETLVLVVAPDYFFYYSLWISRMVQRKRIPLRKGRKLMSKKLKQMKRWADHSPKNYKQKYKLIKAELMRTYHLKGDLTQKLYEEAISTAEENGFLQDIAITNECAANYYMSRGLMKSAKAYMTDAFLGFKEWGADHVAENLLEKYPDLIQQESKSIPAVSLENEYLDLQTIFQMTTTISSEVHFDRLMTKLMNVILTYAGAEDVYLLLNNDETGQFEVIASNHTKGCLHKYTGHRDGISEKYLSASIIEYVKNSQETVVLGDASQKGKFIKDPYIQKKRVKSILCLPIMHQRELTGILYLENNQSTYAFTNERVALLTLFASVAATSIENAYLYSHLEEKVKERTLLLDQTNKQLTKTNQSLAESKEQRRQLLANISHDLRSPIATARHHVDALLEGLVDEPERQQHYLQVVKTRLTSLNGLIEDLFELAQLEVGSSSFSMDIVPIDQLFTHLCRPYDIEMKDRNIAFKWTLPPSIENEYPLVEVDVSRMEQALSNLVYNAIDHSGTTALHISLKLVDNTAIISVTDYGNGIQEDDLPFLFDRFYTNSYSGGQGHGLGLAICKEIMNYHNGEINMSSQQGVGTTFSLSLPTFQVLD